ncbi:MAG: adenine phosphoribosyltransferase, partial [Clostridiales bacterium]|nr:adenine phosphoribosyltransferase [Clostridiales bacterium]
MRTFESYITNIPDYPKPGIVFRDVTSVVQDPEGLKLSIHEMLKKLDGTEFDVVAGAESRGFLFGMPIAYIKNKGFVMIRKQGKLPRETVSQDYNLAYGSATLAMHKE